MQHAPVSCIESKGVIGRHEHNSIHRRHRSNLKPALCCEHEIPMPLSTAQQSVELISERSCHNSARKSPVIEIQFDAGG